MGVTRGPQHPRRLGGTRADRAAAIHRPEVCQQCPTRPDTPRTRRDTSRTQLGIIPDTPRATLVQGYTLSSGRAEPRKCLAAGPGELPMGEALLYFIRTLHGGVFGVKIPHLVSWSIASALRLMIIVIGCCLILPDPRYHRTILTKILLPQHFFSTAYSRTFPCVQVRVASDHLPLLPSKPRVALQELLACFCRPSSTFLCEAKL